MKTTAVTRVQLWCVSAAVLLGGACMGEIEEEAPAPGSSHVVFQASYSKDGRFTVTEDAAGRLGMSVTGATGGDVAAPG